MSVKKIVKVWADGKLISDNISFLQKETKNVFFPLTDNMKLIIQDLIFKKLLINFPISN